MFLRQRPILETARRAATEWYVKRPLLESPASGDRRRFAPRASIPAGLRGCGLQIDDSHEEHSFKVSIDVANRNSINSSQANGFAAKLVSCVPTPRRAHTHAHARLGCGSCAPNHTRFMGSRLAGSASAPRSNRYHTTRYARLRSRSGIGEYLEHDPAASRARGGRRFAICSHGYFAADARRP